MRINPFEHIASRLDPELNCDKINLSLHETCEKQTILSNSMSVPSRPLPFDPLIIYLFCLARWRPL